MASDSGMAGPGYSAADSPTTGARLAVVAALLLLLGATLFHVYSAGVRQTHDVKAFTYTTDAAYRHLAGGRDLAGNPPATAANYASVLAESTSPGWTLLLAELMRIPSFSPDSGRTPADVALLPLAINLLAAATLILIVGHLVRLQIRSGVWMLVLLAAMGLLIPLPLLVMTGMEHVLHACVSLLAIAVGIAVVQRERASGLLILLAMVLTALNVSLRYESLAIALALLLYGWTQGCTGRMLLPFATGVGVAAGFGWFLYAQTGAAVPSPILLHWLPWPIVQQFHRLFGADWQSTLDEAASHCARSLEQAPVGWALLLAAAALLIRERSALYPGYTAQDRSGAGTAADLFSPAARERVGWLFVFVVAGLLHLVFGETAGYGPVGYLVAMGAIGIAKSLSAGSTLRRPTAKAATTAGTTGPVIVGPATLQERLITATPQVVNSRRGKLLIAVCCAIPILVIGWPNLREFAGSWEAGRDAFVRERLAALFVRTYFPNGPVATDTPGVLEYETGARVLDLTGVSDATIGRARTRDEYPVVRIKARVKETGAQVALVSEDEAVAVPLEWKYLGGWQRRGEPLDSRSGVQVFAVSNAMAFDVQTALAEFKNSGAIPADVDFFINDVQTRPATQPSLPPSHPPVSTTQARAEPAAQSSGFKLARGPRPEMMAGNCALCHDRSDRRITNWE